LAEETGGSYFEAREIADVPAIFTRIGQELRGHYLLGFSPESKDGRVHRLIVETKRLGITIHARRNYLAIQSIP
jgi:hypothetical protein